MLQVQVEKRADECDEGKVGFWLLPSDIEFFSFKEAEKVGCSDVILPIEDLTKTADFIAKCHDRNIRAHAWINCLRHKDRWYDPDDVAPTTRAQHLIRQALRLGFDGIFLDDLRYPKKTSGAEKSYQKINKLALELNSVIKAVKPGALTMVGVMPAMEQTYKLYGQCSPCLAAYADIQVPLTFTDEKATDHDFVERVTRWTVEKTAKPVWTGLTAYEDEEQIVPMSQTQLKSLARAAEKGGATKTLIYHYGISLL